MFEPAGDSRLSREKPCAGRRSISRTQWASLAEEIRRDLDGAPYGERLARYKALAEVHGLDVNVVRRTLRALEALDEIAKADADLASRLRREPLVVTEVVARWLKHDQLGALAAGRAYLSGNLTTLSLTEAEKTARPVRAPEKLTVAEWRARVLERARQYLGPDFYVQHEDIDQTMKESPLWSATFYNKKNPAEKAVVFGPGPWRDTSKYSSQMPFVVFSVAGALVSPFVQFAVVVLPDRQQCEAYRQFFDQSPASKYRVEFLAYED
jgi:hypothetical protein